MSYVSHTMSYVTYDIVTTSYVTYDVAHTMSYVYILYIARDIVRTMFNTMSYVARTMSYVHDVRHRT